MKRALIITIISILLFSTFTLYSQSRASGRTLYVRGQWSTFVYENIQDAIDNASDGDIILVDPGTYYENLVINKSITLESNGTTPDLTIIDGSRNGNVIEINANKVKLTGFTIQNGGTFSSNSGIYIQSDNNTISKNIIINNGWNGIYLKNSFSNIIHNNKIENNGHKGVDLYESSDNTITGNIIINNSNYGIFLIRASNNTLTKNMVKNDGAIGIELRNLCNNNTFSSSNISYNYWGIHLLKSYNNTIFENNLANNSYYGVFLQNSSNNSVYHNSFIYNSLKAYDDSYNNSWYNPSLKEGNYWDDYNGNDSNNDGIGDDPYNIPGENNQDKYPLMRSYEGKLPEKPDTGIDTSFLYPMMIIGLIISIIFCIPIALYWRKRYYS